MKKKFAALLLSSTILTASLAAPYTASADELSEKIQKQEQKVNELQNRVQSAEEVLSTVNGEIAAAKQKAAELMEQRVATQEEIAVLEKEIAKLEEIIEQREAQLEDQARSVQVKGSSETYVNFIFASESLTDLVSRVDVVAKMVTANKDLVEKQIEDKNAVDSKKAETQEKLDHIVAMSSELEQLKGQLEVKQMEQESAIAALSAEKATAEQDRQKFVAQKEEADRRAAEEAARQKAAEEAARLAAEEAAKQAAEETRVAAQTVAETETVQVTQTQSVPAPVPTPAPSVVENPVQTPAPSTPVVEEVAPQLPATSGDVIGAAYKYLGVPYVWGGKSPSGFDCSGFTSYVFREAYGINIGASTIPQENAGTQIPLSQVQPGDLLFWGSRGGTYHVAISLGGTQYIHAPSEGYTVQINDFNWFQPQFAVRVAR